MDVLLHVVQTTSASPPSAPSLCDDRSQHTNLDAPVVLSANGSHTSFTVESLRLSRTEARLGSSVSAQWHVALCSPAEDESIHGCDGDPHAFFSAALSRCPPAAPLSPVPSSTVHISAVSVDITDLRGRRSPGGHATTATVDVLREKLHYLCAAFVRAGVGGADAPPVAYAETAFFFGSRLGTRKDALYLTALHRLLVEALLIVKDRALLPPSLPPLDVDVSLVDYDEVWGAGDVLAAEVAQPSAHGTHVQRSRVTWMPLAKLLEYVPRPQNAMTGTSTTLPWTTSLTETNSKSQTSATQLAQLVRQRLQGWFDRIDSATSEFPSAPVSPSPPAAADRLRHLERNTLLFTLRLRRCTSSSTPALQARVSAAYFTLVLLPECGATLLHGEAGAAVAAMCMSSRRAGAALWREFEALSAFMRSLPQSSHCRSDDKQKRSSYKKHDRTTAATVQAQMHAAALRRSRWLTTIARIHDPLTLLTRAPVTATGEHSSDDLVDCFLNSSTVRSFSWIGCIAAAASHQRATRSTLAFLSRLQPPQRARRDCPASVMERSPEKATGAPLARHLHTHHKNAADDTNERDAPRAQAASSSSATSTPPLPSPRPSANAPRPYFSPRPHGGSATSINSSKKARTAAASYLPLSDEPNTTVDPVAASSRVSHASRGSDNNDVSSEDACQERAPPPAQVEALVASLRVYASVLEEEVRRLRRRLQRYEAAPYDSRGSTGDPPVRSPLQETQGYDSSNISVGFSALHATSPGVCDSLPHLVQVAVDDLRTDARFPLALHVKLNALIQRLSNSYTAAVQVRRNDAADSPAVMQQRNEKREVRDAYVAQLEATVALYEQKLALMDYYVAPTLMQCVDELDQWQQQQQHHRQRMHTALTEVSLGPPHPYPTLLPE
ncbi:hypothetical protein LPMP_190800 [Leishmania panamensis]|uniref:Uncharacterized protein n=1 Tax=Leishmania panamensis TaxID=5679 RepID=A0A088RNA4_LEIPA|nr:hypothetical protein LPMP_190800 [Leishmania panamensis]AIN97423.1 hypothetical protein LPMP_190800 [Leishmania panamensis]